MFVENFTGTIILSDERSGENGTQALGALALGGGDAGQITTLVLRNSVSFTGLERSGDAGNYNTTLRHIRVGRDDLNAADALYPWGIVRQEAGAVRLLQDVTEITEGPTPVFPSMTRAEILLSSDKDSSAGSIWEVGGTASLYVPDQLRVGDRASATSMPGAIFRVRGSQAGPIEVDEFDIASDAGLWDADRNDFEGRLRFNRGKSVTEFVLDQGGVTPITVLDNLDIGDYNAYPTGHPMAGTSEYTYGFLRIKLSEPTTAGSGAVGSGNELVLFQADRITSDITSPTGTDYDEGRFVDPDHQSAVGPHRVLFDSENAIDATPTVYRVLADYAGAQYSWRIDYFDGADDGVAEDAVVLSDLQITGVQGDLNGDTQVTEADRQLLLGAITTFSNNPNGYAELLGGAQNLYDLNADDHIDNLDRQLFALHFLAEAGLAGDYNGDMKVDAADYTVWRDNLGAGDESSLNGNGDGMNGVDIGDYNRWKTNFGAVAGAGALAAGAVPEPGTAFLCLAGALGMLSVRRRTT
jgi:hypothetical protein